MGKKLIFLPETNLIGQLVVMGNWGDGKIFITLYNKYLHLKNQKISFFP